MPRKRTKWKFKSNFPYSLQTLYNILYILYIFYLYNIIWIVFWLTVCASTRNETILYETCCTTIHMNIPTWYIWYIHTMRIYYLLPQLDIIQYYRYIHNKGSMTLKSYMLRAVYIMWTNPEMIWSSS